jgi:hypothetical protein
MGLTPYQQKQKDEKGARYSALTGAEYALHRFKQASASGDENIVCRTVENIERAAAVVGIRPHNNTTRHEFWDCSVLLIQHEPDGGYTMAEITDSVEPRNKPY